MENRIRILVTSDIHGHVYPYTYTDGSPADLGLARLSSMIDTLRDNTTLVIDNGDAVYGSPLTFYHDLFRKEEINPITKAMKMINYDYINLGNHDFDLGEAGLQKHLDNVGAPCITSNVRIHGEPLGPTYVIREMAGKKIALFGLTTHSIKDTVKRSLLGHYRVKDALETAKKTVSLIKDLERPDYIIGVYHGGFERDLVNGYLIGEDNGENQAYAMMRDIPGLDILITGHQHTSYCGTAFNTVYTQNHNNGTELACIDIYTDTNVIESRLYQADMEADPKMEALLQEEENECQTWLDAVLAETTMDLSIDNAFEARLHKTQAATFINNFQRELTGAELSACSFKSDAAGFMRQITMRSLINSYPFPDTLYVKKMTGAELRTYLEKTAEFWSIRNDTIIISPYFDSPTRHYFHQYDMVDGIDYTIKVSNDYGSRIVDLTYKGEPVTDEREFTVCFGTYRAIGNGGYGMVKQANTLNTVPGNFIELFSSWLTEHKIVDFEPVNNIHIIK